MEVSDDYGALFDDVLAETPKNSSSQTALATIHARLASSGALGANSGGGSSSTSAWLKNCDICRAGSDTFKWFLTEVKVISGQEVVVPWDICCGLCGTNAEGWPLESSTPQGRKSLANRFHVEAQFRREFLLARGAAERMQAVAFRFTQQVESRWTCGITVKMEVAFVMCQDCNAFFHEDAASILGAEIVTCFLSSSVETHGVLMSRTGLPHKLKWFLAELFGEVQRPLQTPLLLPAETIRMGQAADRFVLACRSMHLRQAQKPNENPLTFLEVADSVREASYFTEQVTVLQQPTQDRDNSRSVH